MNKQAYLQGHKATYRFSGMKSLADRIKAARKHANLTQKDLASKVGVSQPVISQLEKGENLQSVHLVKIASHCNVRAEWLATGKGDMTEGGNAVAEAAATYGSGAADKVMQMLAKHGKGLTDQAQQRLLQAVSDTLSEVKSGNVIPGNFSRAARVQDGDILIPQYDVRASMGHGQVPADYVEFVRNVVVNGLQLEKLGLEYTSPANLSIITGWGQSMAGTIDDKDPVIVDRGVTEFNGDGVYVLTWDGMLYIKRLQKADADHFDMISDNEKHKDRVVPVADVTIHARVLYVWKGQKL